jgi:hypothetical protein
MHIKSRKSQQARHPSVIAAGVLFTFLWLNLQHRAGAVEQLSANVSGSLRTYLKHRQGLEATHDDVDAWLAPLVPK